MTRGEFLKAISIAILAMFGIGSFISSLSRQGANLGGDTAIRRAGRGFGSSRFGD